MSGLGSALLTTSIVGLAIFGLLLLCYCGSRQWSKYKSRKQRGRLRLCAFALILFVVGVATLETFSASAPRTPTHDGLLLDRAGSEQDYRGSHAPCSTDSPCVLHIHDVSHTAAQATYHVPRAPFRRCTKSAMPDNAALLSAHGSDGWQALGVAAKLDRATVPLAVYNLQAAAGIDFESAASRFNWSISNRRESTVWMPYRTLRPAWLPVPNPKEMLRMKSADAPVLWVAPSCSSANRREAYVERLREHIGVDAVWGSGMSRTQMEACPRPRSSSLPPSSGGPTGKAAARTYLGKLRWSKAQLSRVLPSYKFYLAFEESCCEDLVTTQFWRALNGFVVPVVMGAPSIQDYNPNGMRGPRIISTRDYQSAEDLGAHLNYLDRNDTAYLEYLRWAQDLPTARSATQLLQRMHASDMLGEAREPWDRLCSRLYDHVDKLHQSQPITAESVKQARCSPSLECNPYAND